MTDPVQRGFVTFLSAWLLLHETAHEVIEEFVEKGDASAEDDGYLSDLARQVAEERDSLKERLRLPERVSNATGRASQGPSPITGLGVDLEELMARLDRLEGQLAVLDSRIEALSGEDPVSRSRKG